MTYDPVAYWRERGTTYEAKFRADRYREQERALARVLDGLEFDSVLDVGCGFGRIRNLIESVRPAYGGRQPEPDLLAYVGIDLSPDMLASARSTTPDGHYVESSLEDFKPDGVWGLERFDLVIAVEMLMHVPPDDVAAAVRKLDRLSSRYIVTLDWTTPLPRMKVAAHNFLHDYPALLGKGPFGRVREVKTYPVGAQTIHVVSK